MLINRIKTSPVGFTIQLAEFTDIAGLAVFLVFVRYVSDESVYKDLLLCQAIEKATRGEDIFKILDTFFTKNYPRWDLCIAVCADGAKVMTDPIKGVIGLIKYIAPAVKHRHCFIGALAVKKMPSDLKETLNEVVVSSRLGLFILECFPHCVRRWGPFTELCCYIRRCIGYLVIKLFHLCMN